jgi:hypothetical protein
MNRKPQENSQKQQYHVHDISYHLVFCFLTLKELAVIVQCSREFRRLVTMQSFISMYSSKEIIKLNINQSLNSLAKSPFRFFVYNISLQYFPGMNLTSFTTLNLTSFSRLNSVTVDDNRHNWILNHLIIKKCCEIPSLKQLNLPELSIRDLSELTERSHSLEHISSFNNLNKIDLDTCAQLLSRIPSLQSISYERHQNDEQLTLPKQLFPWITSIYFCDYEFKLGDFEEILNIKKLRDLSLDNCRNIGILQFQSLMKSMENQLQFLEIARWNVISPIIIRSVSICKNLKSFKFVCYNDFKFHHLKVLTNLAMLEHLELIMMGDWTNCDKKQIQQELPKLIPSLKTLLLRTLL